MLTSYKRLVVLLEIPLAGDGGAHLDGGALSARRLFEDGRAEELQVRELVSAPQLPVENSINILFSHRENPKIKKKKK